MKTKQAFTLIELLVVIAIISILSALALLTLRGVREDAQQARARSVISKVRELLQEKLESFESRPMPFGFEKDFGIGNPILPAKPPQPMLSNDLTPDWGQQRFIYKRVLCEWIRTEMPTSQEYLFSYPSIESQQPFMPATAPPVGLSGWQQVPNYWPDLMTRNWVGIFIRVLSSRPSPEFQQLRAQLVASTDNLFDNDPLDNEFWIKENNNGWDGVSLPVANRVHASDTTPTDDDPYPGEPLARAIIESSELLYVALYNTYDRDGNRGTHFLRPEDLGDLDGDGFPEIIDNRGLPLIYSLTVQTTGQNGLPVDRNGDGNFDFRDAIPDPRYPGEPQDYLTHIGSIGLDEYPAHLGHLKYADFSRFNVR